MRPPAPFVAQGALSSATAPVDVAVPARPARTTPTGAPGCGWSLRTARVRATGTGPRPSGAGGAPSTRRTAPGAGCWAGEHPRVGARCAAGERAVAAALDALLDVDVLVMHDRVLRRADGRSSKGDIDHLVVAASGLWVIDAKTHKGALEVRRPGGLRRSSTACGTRLPPFTHLREPSVLTSLFAARCASSARKCRGSAPAVSTASRWSVGVGSPPRCRRRVTWPCRTVRQSLSPLPAASRRPTRERARREGDHPR